MKILPASPRARALSLPELVMIMAVVGLLLLILIPGLVPRRKNSVQFGCLIHLKQVALGFQLWASDHDGQYPMAYFTNTAGGPAFADSSNAYRYFQALSNELLYTSLLICPTERTRSAATNFTSDFNNQRLSYFVGLQARQSNSNLFLAGDRDLTNRQTLQNGILQVTTNQNARWSGKLHRGGGNVALADGSAMWLPDAALEKALAKSMATNVLLFP